ncbi:endonuclease domain-containing 1 protein-like [Pygocentrus nattereri]|uniref:Endonuclease domain-containing 1 protein-like n=1 Tax=Pygocentrus nattereri TaxID=42514 RepID=A0AAR2KSM8_PYGNA|nr:endonuclease domain-containing 1 protein-like [Pygocentrus nattereri]XP_017572795.1 endonuclease domain-containing 1 protein-like [Pygocentrus nattereri]
MSLFLSSIMTLLTLLLLALSGCSSEVVNDFTHTCPQFFANPGGTLSPPTVFKGNNYKQICQILNNIPEYATLYDTANRIPVYSAYKFQGRKGGDRQGNWYIEPQLEDKGPQMASESNVKHINNQAVNADYKGTSTHHFVKGHLAPVLHATSQSCANATFTLTNAAPQNDKFNNGEWKKIENAVAKTLEKQCKGNSAYIVTGVVPGPDKLNNRVNIPGHFWTAYCCLDNNLKEKASGAFIGENKNVPVKEMSVKELDRKLSDEYGKVFRVFGSKCN